MEQTVVVRLVRPDLAEPADGVAVELELVDRLAGSDVAKLRGPIGREHDHRHTRLVGLDDGRVQVGRGRPGGAEHNGRDAGGQGRAEGEEAGAALVEDHAHLDLRLSPEGDRQGGRARAGGERRPADAAASQLLGHRGGEGGVAVGLRPPS